MATRRGASCNPLCRLEFASRLCLESVSKAGRDLFLETLRAQQRCREDINSGRLPIAPSQCAGETRTSALTERAGLKAHRRLRNGCLNHGPVYGETCSPDLVRMVSYDGTEGCFVDGHLAVMADALQAQYGRVLFPSEIEARRCQKGLARGARIFAKRVLAALQSCRNRINRSILPLSPEQCPLETRTADAITRAGLTLRATVANTCTDQILGDIGACAATVDGVVSAAGDAGCLVVSHRAAADALLLQEYGR